MEEKTTNVTLRLPADLTEWVDGLAAVDPELDRSKVIRAKLRKIKAIEEKGGK